MSTFNLKSAIHTFRFPEVEYDTGVFLFASGCFSLTPEENAEILLPVCDGYVFLYAAEGRFTVATEETCVEMDASHALLLRTRSGLPCTLCAAAAFGEGIFAVFGGQVTEQIINQFPQNAYMPFFIQPESALLCSLIETVSDAQKGIIADAHQGESRTFEIICALCQRLEQTKTAHGNILVEQAMIIIRERYPYLYSVDELAEQLGISKHHLIREFTYQTGTSPWQFLTRTRIESAKSLLQDSDYTIELIGQLVGYANGNYFCKAFKRQVGITPKEFRKSQFFELPDTAFHKVIEPFVDS